MFKIRNLKIRHSAIALIAAAVVVGTAAFILVHTHQTVQVQQKVVPPSNIVSNDSSSENVISSSKTPSKVSTKAQPGKERKKVIKEPGDAFKPSKKLAIDKFAEFKSKYGLLTVPSYDGSNQVTHPKVLYFANGWHGYRYWMSMTPYPYTDDDYENPSIVVSNDGNNWSVPAGLRNPISGVPADVKIGGHYSDSHLVMRDNVMELWYRYNPGTPKSRRPNYCSNIYYKKTSTDGVHWSAAKYLANFGGDGHLSMAINYENGMYKSWYTTFNGHLLFSESSDSVHWSSPVVASVSLPAGYAPYHQDMIKVGSQYCLLQCAEKASNYTFAEFFASSSDGIHFSNVKRIYPSANTALWNNVSLYRSSMFEKDGKLEMYFALWFKDINRSWYLTHRTFALHDLLPSGSGSSSLPSSKSLPPSSPPSNSSPKSSVEPPKSSAGSSTPSSSEVKKPSGVLPVKQLLLKK
jgi:hypothetical protein